MNDEESQRSRQSTRRHALWKKCEDILLSVIACMFVVVYVPFLILTSPWTTRTFHPCGNGRRDEIKRQREEGMRQPLDDTPLRPLSGSRPRRLTDTGGVRPQLKSKLLQRLPVDIRLLIWEHVVEQPWDAAVPENAAVVHLECVAGSLKHVKCRERRLKLLSLGHHGIPRIFGFQHWCWYDFWARYEEEQKWHARLKILGRRGNLFPLILTCKTIYREAIDIVYKASTFDMRRINTLLRIPAVILPQRLQCIRRLHFSTAFFIRTGLDNSFDYVFDHSYPPDDLSKWPRACKVLASMSQLHELRIELVMWRPFDSLGEGSIESAAFLSLLRPLKEVHASSKFEVILDQPLTATVEEELGPVSFKIIHCPYRSYRGADARRGEDPFSTWHN